MAARLVPVACLVPAACLALAGSAGAAIEPARTIAGPSNEIVGVDGAAMAPDGSGGVLYRRQAQGVAHLFAVPFAGGRWGASVEVDSEDAYGSSQPAIAAGEGGRLLVVWVQPRNLDSRGVKLYELMSASLQPGAGAFGQAIVVDPNVGEPFTGEAGHVEPKLAMAPDGAAYAVWRVVTDGCGFGDEQNPRNPECPPGRDDELVDVRAARFNYLLWSSLGTINRAPQIAMRKPTPANAPSIGIGVEGNGVVAWQEPGSDGVARIWVRRLFGAVRGNVLQASPETLGGRSVTSDAETPQVATSRYGEAEIAFRIDGGNGSAVPTTQLFLNSLPSTFDPHGAQLEGPHALPSAASADLSAPSGALDPRGDFRVCWSQGGDVRLASGGERRIDTPVALGSGVGPVETTIDPAGGGTAAWRASVAGLPVVEAREDYATGAYQSAQLAGGVSGPVSGLTLAGSGQGDALIAWMQGPPGRSEVVGDFVQAPPAPFVVSTPSGWVRARDAVVTWEPTSDAVAGVVYVVYADGRPVARDLHGTRAALGTALLGDGVHRVQVLASDSAGQRTMSAKTELRVDANPPLVKVALIDRRQGVRVSVRDRASGVEARASWIGFGDGAHAHGGVRFTHRYTRAGLYAITARVRDLVGNQATVHLQVRVR